MNDEIIYLYDEYTHTRLSRRVFIERLTKLAGGAAAAMAMLPLLEGTDAAAAMVAEDDPRLDTRRDAFQGASGEVRGYMARPEGHDKLPAVVVIHQNKGLTAHIEDVARRVALEGYLALAPDALSPFGGAPKDPDEAKKLIRKLDRGKTLGDFLAAVSYLKGHAESTGKVGCMGFCWGGTMSNQLAVNSKDLAAAVVYYGGSPKPEDVAKIGAPLLLHYAGLDERIGKGVPGYEAALKKANKDYTLHIYPNVHHAFNDDTRAVRYDKAAAELAWKRTFTFFEKTLQG
jgi:carboxymethylenebutenolidase